MPRVLSATATQLFSVRGSTAIGLTASATSRARTTSHRSGSAPPPKKAIRRVSTEVAENGSPAHRAQRKRPGLTTN